MHPIRIPRSTPHAARRVRVARREGAHPEPRVGRPRPSLARHSRVARRAWRRRGRRAQVSAIATLFGLLLVVTFIGNYLTTVLPGQMSSNDLNHGLLVEDQVGRLATLLRNEVSADAVGAQITQPVSLGSSGEPPFQGRTAPRSAPGPRDPPRASPSPLAAPVFTIPRPGPRWAVSTRTLGARSAPHRRPPASRTRGTARPFGISPGTRRRSRSARPDRGPSR